MSFNWWSIPKIGRRCIVATVNLAFLGLVVLSAIYVTNPTLQAILAMPFLIGIMFLIMFNSFSLSDSEEND